MNLRRQPTSVLAVAFAAAIAFMGIGLVDPILKPIAEELGASHAQVSLLFSGYMVVMGLAMLITGWLAGRIGAKNSLLLGLAIILVSTAIASTLDSVTGLVIARAGWGLGNAVFFATALATIIAHSTPARASRSGSSDTSAIMLFEAALGVGLAAGPLLGGQLGAISWRAPFAAVAVLMLVALLSTWRLVPATPQRSRVALGESLSALRHHAGLLRVSVSALFYSVGFFTLLAVGPFPMHLDAVGIGWVFFAWGALLAITSLWLAPRLAARFGMVRTTAVALLLFAADLGLMAAAVDHRVVVIVGVIVAGAILGITNTLLTSLAMAASPVERPIAAAGYSFVRFAGAAAGPLLGGLASQVWGLAAPFALAGLAVLIGSLVLTGVPLPRGYRRPIGRMRAALDVT